MKNYKTKIGFVLLTAAALINCCYGDSGNSNKELKLWYEQPGNKWEQALPVGNGRLGAMVFGGIESERIQLNEDSVWGGPPVPVVREGAYKHYMKARKAIFDGDHALAEKIIKEDFLSPRISPRSHQTLGDLYLEFDLDKSAVSNYTRELDLETAIAKTEFKLAGVTYTREVFTSAVDDVIVVKLSADKGAMIRAREKQFSKRLLVSSQKL